MEHEHLRVRCRVSLLIGLRAILVLLFALGSCLSIGAAQGQAAVTASIQWRPAASAQRSKRPLPSAVLWLMPLQPVPAPAPEGPHPSYTLLQKNRGFVPHVLVVPLGTPVSFPNADPFFHNVFSLYNGKRFDLGLYEKGINRQVVFNHEGVSYIFCNIHPEMSAVVLALKTRWWARADDNGTLKIDNVPTGDYEVHLWVEGVDAVELERWDHRVHLVDGQQSVGSLTVNANANPLGHMNKFGGPYLPDTKPY